MSIMNLPSVAATQGGGSSGALNLFPYGHSRVRRKTYSGPLEASGGPDGSISAIVVWRVDRERVGFVSRVLSSFPEVSRCYGSPHYPAWTYNLCTVVRSGSRRDCLCLIRNMSELTMVQDYRILFVLPEFRRPSPPRT